MHWGFFYSLFVVIVTAAFSFSLLFLIFQTVGSYNEWDHKISAEVKEDQQTVSGWTK